MAAVRSPTLADRVELDHRLGPGVVDDGRLDPVLLAEDPLDAHGA